MTNASYTGSAAALSAHLQSLEGRLANFESDRKFDDRHSARAEAIRLRRRAIEQRIDAAIANGDHWAMVREEFARDAASVSDELDDFMAGVDAKG